MQKTDYLIFMNVLCSLTKTRKRKTVDTAPAVQEEQEQNIFKGNTVVHNGLKAKVTDVDWPAKRIDLSYFMIGGSYPPPKYGVPISAIEIVPEKVIIKAPGALLQSW